jgi:DNA polymerase-3 subunit alpha
MSFVHLHARTHYSFLDGAMSPVELVKAAKQAGMNAVAMTDAANLCGLVEFNNACKAEGIKPIFGCELWIGHRERVPVDAPPAKKTKAQPPQLPMQPSLFSVAPPPPKVDEPEWIDGDLVPQHHLVLLVENEAGYHNLCTLITVAHQQRHFAPVLELEQLLEHSDGLICLTSGLYGPSGVLDDAQAEERIAALQRRFTNRIYLELVDWGLEEDEVRNRQVRKLSKRLQIPTVVTNDCHYVNPEDTTLLNVLRSIGIGHAPTDMSSPYVHATDQATIKSESEMLELFPEDTEAVHRAAQISEQCTFAPVLGGLHLPNSTPPDGTIESQWAWLIDTFPPPHAFQGQDMRPPHAMPEGWSIVDAYFAWYARTGLEVRLQTEEASTSFASREEYEAGLEEEIRVIIGMKFPAYHLIVAEFINWSKDNGISVGPGRGSAAGSIVVWSMRITDINPKQFQLMFERFLNPKRISMPDIDVDFEQGRREEVLQHVRDKYGDDCVAQILTIGTMKAKAALKDCARVCATHFGDADAWSKRIPDGPKVKLWPSIEEDEKLLGLYEGDPHFRNVASLAVAVEGKPRQTGIHAAGVIITSRPVSDFVPLHNEEGTSMTGIEMTGAEKMGLVKFDFLGLKTLDIIELACSSVERRTGIRPAVVQPFFDDPAVYELLASGDALGLFQVESDGMQKLLRDMKTDSMNDIVAISALYRPGPLGSGMVQQYVDCKVGNSEPTYPHVLLEDVLRPTYGVFVYQEQVMQAAQVLAGFDLGDADLLRRAMGKKKQSEMDAQRAKFVEGCRATNNIDEETSTSIFNLIDHFAGYGFNKSHSASYGVITYMTAYLKAHHRADLMAAAMTLEQANRDKLVAYVTDCIQTGVLVLPPDINKSGSTFTVESHEESRDGLAIRYGLGAIKGVGGTGLDQILEARSIRPFASMSDLQERGAVKKNVMEALICSGALDAFTESRFDAWWSLRKPKAKSKLKKKDAKEQIYLLDGRTAGEADAAQMAKQEAEAMPDPWTFHETLDREHEVLGCWLSGHPLDRFRDIEVRYQTLTQICDLGTMKKDIPLTIYGVITKIHQIRTRSGRRMTYFSVNDRTGMHEVVVRPNVWEFEKDKVTKGSCVEVIGRLDRDGEDGRLVVDTIISMSERRRNVKGYEIVLYAWECTDELIQSIHAVMTPNLLQPRKLEQATKSLPAEPGATVWCVVKTEDPTKEIIVRFPGIYAVRVDQELIDKIDQIIGRPNAMRRPGSTEVLPEHERAMIYIGDSAMVDTSGVRA